MKMIINAGIMKVLYAEGYPDDLSHELINESGIIVQKVKSDERSVPDTKVLSSEIRGTRCPQPGRNGVRSGNSKLKTKNLKLRSKKA
jgi:deoxycytidylate deaminase